jgi:hypothetical protein
MIGLLSFPCAAHRRVKDMYVCMYILLKKVSFLRVLVMSPDVLWVNVPTDIFLVYVCVKVCVCSVNEGGNRGTAAV